MGASQVHISLGGHSIHEILELSEESERQSIQRSITKILKFKELEQIEVKAFPDNDTTGAATSLKVTKPKIKSIELGKLSLQSMNSEPIVTLSLDINKAKESFSMDNDNAAAEGIMATENDEFDDKTKSMSAHHHHQHQHHQQNSIADDELIKQLSYYSEDNSRDDDEDDSEYDPESGGEDDGPDNRIELSNSMYERLQRKFVSQSDLDD